MPLTVLHKRKDRKMNSNINLKSFKVANNTIYINNAYTQSHLFDE